MTDQPIERTAALSSVRRRRIVEILRAETAITVARVQQDFDVSAMTARRDLAELERQGLARRTHGGAVLPAITSHEDSFASRLARGTGGKTTLGQAAADLVAPGESVFLDSSSTAYHVARSLLDRGIALTLITNSQPIMELVTLHHDRSVELIGIGGSMRRLTRSFVGPLATNAIDSYYADRLFFSVKGLSESGVITDADPLEAEVKRSMIEHAETVTLLVDRSKLGLRGLAVIDQLRKLDLILASGFTTEELDALSAHGVDLRAIAEDDPTDEEAAA
ncbi:MAG: DeoR/GlpR family DNA-binding transcription regulator [Solirubrobacteraceae bacterium]|nr:DeoR/GlpR family DNA-binding transcription regulator [Patulibacter sp.]